MTRRPYFVIFGAMRTGSNLLERTLAELGDTVCYGEAFNPAFIGGPKQHELFGWDLAARDANPEGFLETLRLKAGRKIPGFRLFDDHAPALAQRILRDPDCRRIVLQRDPLASYLSLKAARATGQWMLRNPARRIPIRVAFDGDEFETYREKLRVHYAGLAAEIADACTDAMMLDYEDLTDHAVLSRSAQHIGSAGDIPEAQPILRQNPTSLTERVSNYEEMCAWLGLHPEPRLPLALPTGAEILICRGAPLAVAPIPGPGADAALSLVYRIDQRSFGGASLSYAQLLDPAARQAVFASGLHAEVLLSELAGRRLLAIVCHPLRRMHALFQTELFGRDWHGSPIRKRLVSLHGGIPSPREIVEGKKTLEPERHLAAFTSFLEIVETAQSGEGEFPDHVAWRSQAETLQSIQKDARIDTVATIKEFAALAAHVASQLGVPLLREVHVEAVLERALGPYLDFDVARTPGLADRVHRLHADDYTRFGYGILS